MLRHRQYASLDNNVTIPMVGMGASKSNGEAIKAALESGYRHFDCAHVYRNEVEIGQTLSEQLNKGSIQRAELFVASKLGVNSMHPDMVAIGYETTLKNLQLDYLDLYYIHWPFSLKYDGPENLFPADRDGNPLFDESISFVDTWTKMEELYHSGRVKAIGVCNFNICQLETLLKNCNVRPHVHQFECHPYLNQAELIAFCKEHRITPVAYSPLCCKDYKAKATDADIFKDQTMRSLSDKYEKSIAQIALRFQIQRGVAVIPRSSNRKRMMENLSIYDFCLSDSDMIKIASLNKNARAVYPDRFAKHRDFPFRC